MRLVDALANLFTKADPPVPTEGATSEVAHGGNVNLDKLNADLTHEYVRSIYLWRCVDMIASMTASVPLKIYKKDESQLTRPQLAVEQLLRRPNPQWSGHALQFYAALCLAVANKAYLLRVRGVGGITQELWPLAPNEVLPLWNLQDGTIEAFQVTRANSNGIPVKYPVDPQTGDSDIIWIWRPALNRATDRAPAHVAAAPAEVFTRILQRCADIVSNSSNITGMLSTESELSKKAIEEIKDHINKFRTGQEQSGGTLVSANARWSLTRLSEDPSSALSVQIKDSIARDVAMTFGVPSQLLALPGTDTYNNLAQARVGFVTDCILPNYIGLYVSGLNHALMTNGNGANGAEIKPDVENIPAMIAGRRDMITMTAQATMLSINEQRALLGYPKYEQSDPELEAGYADADVPVMLETLRLKRLAVEAQYGAPSAAGGGMPATVGRTPTAPGETPPGQTPPGEIPGPRVPALPGEQP